MIAEIRAVDKEHTKVRHLHAKVLESFERGGILMGRNTLSQRKGVYFRQRECAAEHAVCRLEIAKRKRQTSEIEK